MKKNTAHTDHHVQQANVKCLSSLQNSFYVELDNKMMPFCHADAVNNKIHIMQSYTSRLHYHSSMKSTN